jgi:hypothetical protein
MGVEGLALMGLGFRVEGFGFSIHGLMVWGVWGFGFRFKVGVWDLLLKVYGIRVGYSGFWVFRFKV